MRRGLRLLLIEDNEHDAALLVHEVRRGGYDPIVHRVDTRAGLNQALDQHWDIILCDFRLPGFEAPAAVAVVRARVDTPCIIVSGSVGEERAAAAMRSGAKDFVLKDNMSRLVPAIERELRDSEVRLKRAVAESALRATEESFRAAFDLIPDGVLVCRDGLVTHSNGSVAALLGASIPGGLFGLSMLELFAPSAQEAVRERLNELGRSNAPAPPTELTMIRLDGCPVHVEITAMSVLFDGQRAALVVIRDVSARRELIARTMHVDRVLAVGTLAAGVGHEINNALAYVMANVTYASVQITRVQQELEKLVEREASLGKLSNTLSDVVGILAEVDEGNGRIRDIVRDLNTFARHDEEPRLVDLRAAADSALRMATPEIRDKARVVRRYQDVPPVRASASRVGQILLNLVINAAQAIDDGAFDSNEIAVCVRPEGANVIVDIRDTGCGIAPEHRELLFTPFFTTKPIGRGTGLGLSISKRIAQSLGGDIEVDSTPGRGTTMRVLLPAVTDARPLDAPWLPTSVRERWLFIDDERPLGVAFQRALFHEHDIVVVETATQALAMLTAGEAFDVIFCDVNMPTMTGVELYETVERSMPWLAAHFVMVTGGGHGPRTKAFLEKGNTPVLEKPLDMAQVRSVVARMRAAQFARGGARSGSLV